MLRVDLHSSEKIAVIRVGQMTGLTEADFKGLTDIIDEYLRDCGDLNGIVIVSKEFPGWDDFEAFISHIKFVRKHHRMIKKVALVTSSALLSAAPLLIDHFVNAKARHFDFNEIDEAKEWAEIDEEPAGYFDILEGYPKDVIACRATGTISHDDYVNTLIPAVEAKIEQQGKVKLLVWCGHEFEGATAGAMWEDACFGMTHIGDFARIAVVSDIGWLRKSAKLFAPLISAPIQFFHDDEIDEAKLWISSSNDQATYIEGS